MTLFRRLAVVLDHLAPNQGAFAHALDWAWRWQVPIHGIADPTWISVPEAPGRTQGLHGGAAGGTSSVQTMPRARWADPAEIEQACASACARRGVRWEASHWHGAVADGLRPLIGTSDLLVLGQALPRALKSTLLGESLRDRAPAVLVCPDTWTPLSRMLLLDQGSLLSDRLLVTAAELCRSFRAAPVVLTVARSERAAQLRQHAARAALAEHGLDADFDFVIGSDVHTAVVSVARWRRCQLIVMERHDSPPWWRWLRATSAEWFMDLVEAPTFLAMPSREPVCGSSRPL
jgi:hypothetical protein